MFISKKVIFIELHKTGSTHIQYILAALLSGKLVGKHNQVSSNQFIEGRFFLGSVRDPWEWYVSLWAYGCDKKGGLYNHLVNQDKSSLSFEDIKKPYDYLISSLHLRGKKRWAELYKDVNDVEAFREWLSRIHNSKYIDNLGEGYSDFSINKFCGLMTYRYLVLFCCKRDDSDTINNISTFSEVQEYDKEKCFIDYFIRNEKLESDLFCALEKMGEHYSHDTKLKIALMEKTNVSSGKMSLECYYDTATERIVGERDRLIVEKFGYVAPSLRFYK